MVERDLLGVCDQSAVDVSIFALELLFLDGQVSCRSSQVCQTETREEQVHHDHHGSFRSDRGRCPVNINEDIEEWLACVRVQLSHAFAELVDVVGKELIGICDTIIQICHFVVRVASKSADWW